MRRLSVLVIVLLVAVAAVGIGVRPSAAQTGGKLRVVTGTAILMDMVQQVGGERVDAFSLVPPGADPHTYQPTPRDVQSLQGARIAVWNGLGLDDTAAALVASQRLSLTTVVASDGLHPLGVDEELDDDEGADDHSHTGGNPHLWLDPTLAIRYVERIRDGLSEADPAGAVAYQANAERYVEEIAALDQWATGEIATIPAERRRLVTFHDAFPYLAQHYGLELVGVVLKSPGREPSAQEVATLVTQLGAQQIPAVYTEPQFNARILELAAKDAGVQVRRLYSDSFDRDVKTYLDLMRYNVTSLVEGLR